MRKLAFFFLALASIGILQGCKKDSKSPPDNTGGKITTKEVQVVLPVGVSLDLSKTTLFSYSQSARVGADGKSQIPYKTGTQELAYLFDASNNLLMMGIISDANSQISITSTTEALLYLGLCIPYSYSEEQRAASIVKIKTYESFAGLNTKLEEYFKADVIMLSKSGFMADFIAAVDNIKKVQTIDIYAKQIKVEDADELKSGIKINQDESNAENFNFSNDYLRRAYAFLYKTSFRDLNDQEKSRISQITTNTAADQNMGVKGATMDARLRAQSVTTGPVSVPLGSDEKQATYKVRVIGVGGNANGSLTAAENAKLEELWEDYFALDLLMPSLFLSLENTNAQYQIRSNGPDAARAFIDEVKKYMTGSMMENVKDGNYTVAIADYMKIIHDDYYKRVAVYQQLSQLGKMASQAGDNWGVLDEDIEKENERIGKVGSFAAKIWDGVKTHLDDQLAQIHYKCNTMDEWTVKVMDNDVKLTPRNSDVMTFVNHTLTVSANPALDAGETVEYEWTTAGSFGVLKNGTQEGTAFTTTAKTIIYQGKNAPNENNIERVFVTAYIKNSAGSKKKLGSDTATINVKKLSLMITPKDMTLSPANGVNSVKLHVTDALGKNPLINDQTVQYKVEWSTPGAYGHFAGGVKSRTTTDNFITYEATDKSVQQAGETIIARVYFKLASTGWMLREEVKGTVGINNKAKVFYVPRIVLHGDTSYPYYSDGRHLHTCVKVVAVTFKEDPKATHYSVKFLDIPGLVGEEITTSWQAGKEPPASIPSYVGDEYANGVFTIGNYASSRNSVDGAHVDDSSPTGGALVSVFYD